MKRDWSRRRFIQRGVVGGLLLGVTGTGFLAFRPGAAEPLPFVPASLSPQAFTVLLAIARRMVPARPGFPSVDEAELGERADRLLAQLDAPSRAELEGVLRLFDNALVALLFGGPPRPFTRLTPQAQDGVLADWEGSALALRRTGFQALRTLILGCYHASPKTWAAVGYPGPPEGFHQPEQAPWRGGDVPRPSDEGEAP